MVQVVFAFRGYSSNRKQLHQLIFGKNLSQIAKIVLIDVYRGTDSTNTITDQWAILNN